MVADSQHVQEDRVSVKVVPGLIQLPDADISRTHSNCEEFANASRSHLILDSNVSATNRLHLRQFCAMYWERLRTGGRLLLYCAFAAIPDTVM